MRPNRLTSYRDRLVARAIRDTQWAFMERVAREGIVWMCPWDKYHRHGSDGVYVFGLLGSNEPTTLRQGFIKPPPEALFHWIESHKDWWKRGRWSEKRCARSIRITEAGRAALRDRAAYDMEPVRGGMVKPGWVCTPARGSK